MIKKIIALDIGNVLYYVKNENFISQLEEIQDKEALKIFEKDYNPLINLLCNGMDVGLFSWDEILFNHPEIEQIKEAWNSIIVKCEPMVDFVDTLLEDGHTVCLLSNIGKDHAQVIKKDPVLNRCEHYFSYEMGVRKPHSLFYDFVEKDLKNKYSEFDEQAILRQPEIMFFDDKEENIGGSGRFFKYAYNFNLNKFKTEEEALNAMKSYLYFFLHKQY